MRQSGWTVEVPVPADRAYARLADFERMPEYVEGLSSVRRVGGDVLRIDGDSGRWDWRITQAMPGRSLVLEPLDAAGPALRIALAPGTVMTAVTVRVSQPEDGPPLRPHRERLMGFLSSD